MIDDFLVERCSISRAIGTNGDGETQYAVTAGVSCKFQMREKVSDGLAGKVAVAETIVFLALSQAVEAGDLIADPATAVLHEVRRVAVRRDLDGDGFKVATLGG